MKKEKIILASFRAESLAKLLNGEKNIDIRKIFPHNFRGWVYAYLTKKQGHNSLFKFVSVDGRKAFYKVGNSREDRSSLNGKIICKFYINKTEEIYMPICKTSTLSCEELCRRSGMTTDGISKYLHTLGRRFSGKATYISSIDIFDEPLDLEDFIVISTGKPPKSGPDEIMYVEPAYEPKFNLCDKVYIKRDGKVHKCKVIGIDGSKRAYKYEVQTIDAPWKACHVSEEDIYKTLADIPTAKQEVEDAVNAFNDLITSEEYLKLPFGIIVAKVMDIQIAARALEPRKDIKIILVNHKDTEE